MLSRCIARSARQATCCSRAISASAYSTATPASPSPSSSTAASAVRSPAAAASSPSPRQRYKREEAAPRDLPKLPPTTPILLGVALVATLSWGGFLFYATNTERANSSVVRSLAFQLRSSPVVQEFLGPNVKLPPLFGEFKRVKGSINMLAGRIDVQFRVKGANSAGTAAFTSVRRGKEGRFEVLRWKITRDDGAVLDLQARDPRDLHAVSETPTPVPPPHSSQHMV